MIYEAMTAARIVYNGLHIMFNCLDRSSFRPIPRHSYDEHLLLLFAVICKRERERERERGGGGSSRVGGVRGYLPLAELADIHVDVQSVFSVTSHSAVSPCGGRGPDR